MTKYSFPKSRYRGLSHLEMIAACAAMVVVMSFVTTLCFRISRVWRDIGHQRAAVAELSNRLDRLTRLGLTEIETEIDSIRLSDQLIRTLFNPQMTGELIETEFGTQVRLKLMWGQRHPLSSVSMSAWTHDYVSDLGGNSDD